ncbi:MAG: pantoate--beta-alanine ligase [Ferruginibacter sp.]
MIIYKSASAIKSYLQKKKDSGKTIGFVPTMGALHDGHISLVENSKKKNELTIVSIFVNPTQFNNPADFEKYPITLDQDINKLEENGCDVLFIPSQNEIYPGTTSTISYELGSLEKVLEGAFRPGHFQGVSQVVHRLLDIVIPHDLYLGQKDYQQCLVIKKLVEIIGINLTVHIHPTKREKNGLAMSSRNKRLSNDQLSQAAKIYESMMLIRNEMIPGDISELKNKAIRKLIENNFKVDYVEIVETGTLEIQEKWDGRKSLTVVAAAFLHDVRLIDNLILN